MYECKYVVQYRNMINLCKGHDLQQCVLSIKRKFDILPALLIQEWGRLILCPKQANVQKGLSSF